MPAILRNRFVLSVHDLRRSADFYVGVLGFHVVAEPPGWIFVERDGCMIMIGACPDDQHPRDIGSHNYFGYLLVDDVDAFHREVTARGVELVMELSDRPWGMREFGIRTVDGHRIMIAHALA